MNTLTYSPTPPFWPCSQVSDGQTMLNTSLFQLGLLGSWHQCLCFLGSPWAPHELLCSTEHPVLSCVLTPSTLATGREALSLQDSSESQPDTEAVLPSWPGPHPKPLPAPAPWQHTGLPGPPGVIRFTPASSFGFVFHTASFFPLLF